jgi:hypothetical protein
MIGQFSHNDANLPTTSNHGRTILGLVGPSTVCGELKLGYVFFAF